MVWVSCRNQLKGLVAYFIIGVVCGSDDTGRNCPLICPANLKLFILLNDTYCHHLMDGVRLLQCTVLCGYGAGDMLTRSYRAPPHYLSFFSPSTYMQLQDSLQFGIPFFMYSSTCAKSVTSYAMGFSGQRLANPIGSMSSILSPGQLLSPIKARI